MKKVRNKKISNGDFVPFQPSRVSKEKSVAVGLRLSPELHTRLKTEAERLGCSVPRLATLAIEYALNNME